MEQPVCQTAMDTHKDRGRSRSLVGIAISSSSASVMGAIAAIALPPLIAVPLEIW